MSYSIKEELDDRRAELAALKRVAERWPEAHRLVYTTLNDDNFAVWRVDVPYSECNMFRLIKWQSEAFGMRRDTLMICVKHLAGGVAVVPIRHVLHTHFLFGRQRNPEEATPGLSAQLLEQFEKEATVI